MSITHEFSFSFTTRDQFYAIVRFLNHECGKGNWTIKGKVLKGLKRNEQYRGYLTYAPAVTKVVVVPTEHAHVEAMIKFVHSDENVKNV